jgi:hypothetical protein
MMKMKNGRSRTRRLGLAGKRLDVGCGRCRWMDGWDGLECLTECAISCGGVIGFGLWFGTRVHSNLSGEGHQEDDCRQRRSETYPERNWLNEVAKAEEELGMGIETSTKGTFLAEVRGGQSKARQAMSWCEFCSVGSARSRECAGPRRFCH